MSDEIYGLNIMSSRTVWGELVGGTLVSKGRLTICSLRLCHDEVVPLLVAGPLADRLREHYGLCSAVRVTGRMTRHRWKEDSGRQHSAIVLMAEHIDFEDKEERREQA